MTRSEGSVTGNAGTPRGQGAGLGGGLGGQGTTRTRQFLIPRQGNISGQISGPMELSNMFSILSALGGSMDLPRQNP